MLKSGQIGPEFVAALAVDGPKRGVKIRPALKEIAYQKILS
jgi:hypothetical protein